MSLFGVDFRQLRRDAGDLRRTAHEVGGLVHEAAKTKGEITSFGGTADEVDGNNNARGDDAQVRKMQARDRRNAYEQQRETYHQSVAPAPRNVQPNPPANDTRSQGQEHTNAPASDAFAASQPAPRVIEDSPELRAFLAGMDAYFPEYKGKTNQEKIDLLEQKLHGKVDHHIDTQELANLAVMRDKHPEIPRDWIKLDALLEREHIVKGANGVYTEVKPVANTDIINGDSDHQHGGAAGDTLGTNTTAPATQPNAAAPAAGDAAKPAATEAAADSAPPVDVTSVEKADVVLARNYGAGDAMPKIGEDQVEAVQKLMADQLPKYGADNKWGRETQAAFLNKCKAAGIENPAEVDFTQPDNEATKTLMAYLEGSSTQAVAHAKPEPEKAAPAVATAEQQAAPAAAVAAPQPQSEVSVSADGKGYVVGGTAPAVAGAADASAAIDPLAGKSAAVAAAAKPFSAFANLPYQPIQPVLKQDPIVLDGERKQSLASAEAPSVAGANLPTSQTYLHDLPTPPATPKGNPTLMANKGTYIA